MKMMLVAFLAAAACFIGLSAGNGCADPDSPVDFSGRTSIIVELENGDWCELRGPARFYVLDHFTEPDRAVRNGDFVRSADSLGTAGYVGSP